MSARATLTVGQWFMYPTEGGIPSSVTIYTGDVLKRKAVRKITKMQALALCRYHSEDWTAAYIDGNGRWIDVNIVGDIDAWYGDDEPDNQEREAV